MRALLCVLLAAPALAARSGDGRLSWEPGDSYVAVRSPGSFSARGRRVTLPALEKGARRRVAFAARGDRFAVLDEAAEAVGLHRDAPRGSRAAQALVTGALVRLMDSRGRVHWTRRLPETHAVGGEGGAPPLAVGADGTAALLLQDADPYTTARPLVLVLDPKGRELLRLDYTAWSRVDEMALSDDGRWLALRGIGRLPADDSWGSALGHYRLSDGDRAVFPTASASGGRSLRGVDAAGRACCLAEGKALAAVGHDGRRDTVPAEEAERLFGPAP